MQRCTMRTSGQILKTKVSTVHINCLRFLYSNNEYRLDLYEDIEKNVVTATFEFPGFSKDEVQIDFQNGKLTVSAETKKSDDHAETGYTLRERLHGKFSRTIQLPEGVQVRRFFKNIFEELFLSFSRMSRSKRLWKMVF